MLSFFFNMLKAAAGPNQTKITDYCELVEKVEVLLSSNSECSNIIMQLPTHAEKGWQ